MSKTAVTWLSLGSMTYNKAKISPYPTFCPPPIRLCRFRRNSQCPLAFPLLPAMLKRRTDAPKAARKKKKGNTTYTLDSLDPISEDEMATEGVRVWNISTSETTGRVMANRKTLKHHHQVLPSSPEEPSTSEKLGRVEGDGDVEDVGVLADSESSKIVEKRRPKRKRVRAHKENDSVSELLISPALCAYGFSRQRWNSGF